MERKKQLRRNPAYISDKKNKSAKCSENVVEKKKKPARSMFWPQVKFCLLLLCHITEYENNVNGSNVLSRP